MKVLLLFAVIIASASCLKWRGYDDNGNPVARTFTILRAPPKDPHVIEWRAVQRSFSDKKRNIDAIQFTFSTNFFPHYTIRHFTKDSDSLEARAARHGLRKIIEYEDSGNPGYDPDVDVQVSNYSLWNRQWTQIGKVQSTVNGANLVEACTHTTDGIVELCLLFTDIVAELTVNGSKFTVDNNAIHHTLRIQNNSFVSPTSRLSLKTHLHVREKVVDFNDPNSVDANSEAALNLGSASDDADNVHPVAAWSKSVEACGGSAPVVRDVLRDVESMRDIDFGFPNNGSMDDGIQITLIQKLTYHSFLTNCSHPDIYWDPDLGIVDNSNSSSGYFLLPSMFLSILMAAYALL